VNAGAAILWTLIMGAAIVLIVVTTGDYVTAVLK